MTTFTTPRPMNWQIELAFLTEANTFPHSQEDIACSERRIAAAKQKLHLIGRFTIPGPVGSRAAMPSRIAA